MTTSYWMNESEIDFHYFSLSLINLNKSASAASWDGTSWWIFSNKDFKILKIIIISNLNHISNQVIYLKSPKTKSG